jgi:hypothetical protein
MQFFLYSLYDVNHDGYITRAEMLAVTSAIYDLLGDSSSAADHCPQSHVNMIFKVHNFLCLFLQHTFIFKCDHKCFRLYKNAMDQVFLSIPRFQHDSN